MQVKDLILGIDTGGTYTDAVVFAPGDKKVIATAKVATNHRQLADSVTRALETVLQEGDIAPEKLARLAISTTLATNAVVEGRGSRVGLFIIGTTRPFDLPAEAIRFLDGGHDHLGREVKPLDLGALVDAVALMRPYTDAYAVCAAMSMENPAHEKVAAKAIELVDPKPVFCSHQVSSRAGMRERAATALINARLLPEMQSFVAAVKHALKLLGASPKVSMIRGDGSYLPLDEAVRRAAETVASGPAASIVFGSCKVPGQTALVVDVGGTTTDISRIENGRPVIDQQGSLIGGWQTHVAAVDTYTVGIGGDSRVVVTRKGKLLVGPLRVVPVCMDRHAPPADTWLRPATAGVCILKGKQTDQNDTTDPVMQKVAKAGAMSFEQLLAGLSMAEPLLEARLKHLVHGRKIKVVGFTPTDALHVLGRIELGDCQRAMIAARTFADALGIEVEQFCRRVLDVTCDGIQQAVLDYTFRAETGKTLSGFFPRRTESRLLELGVKLLVPLLGLGAAAGELLPQVAERLGTELILPGHCQVGSALGAALAFAG